MSSRRLAAITPPRLVVAGLLVVGLVLRWQFVDFQSGDYRAFLDPWYTHLAENGGFAALKDSFSNYNTPYLVLLAALTYLPIPQLVGIKAISVVFDVALAGLALLLVRRLRPGARWLPVIAFGVVLLLPTVVMNGSVWAQCDSIYATFCLASLYFLISRRPWLACVAFGLAFAFKLQAVFFLPALVAIVIINRHRLLALLAIPAAFFAALLPALVAGRSLASQLAVYPAQITNSSGAVNGGGGGGRTGGTPGGGGMRGGGMPGGGPGGGGGGAQFGGGGGGATTSGLTNNAPTPYAWLPSDASDVWKYLGLGLAAVVAIGFAIWLLSRRRELTATEIVLVAATSVLVIPILLPDMHERYFYLAEVLAVVAVFLDRRFVIVAVALQVASISTYLTYLDNLTILPLGVAAVFALAAAVTAAVVLVRRLRRPAEPVALSVAAEDRTPDPVLTAG